MEEERWDGGGGEGIWEERGMVREAGGKSHEIVLIARKTRERAAAPRRQRPNQTVC
jgi:hypothetical protein